MRKSLFCLALLLVGCGGNGVESAITPDRVQPPAQPPQQPVAQHVPEIRAVALSPDTVSHMAGDGDIDVTAAITFKDVGLDIQTLWVRMPDGASIEFSESLDTETGTFTERLVMSTAKTGTFTVELWLVDKADNSSEHRTVDFEVVEAPRSVESDWISRVSRLPYVLNDVVWDGNVFIAVGDSGAVLTSSDGLGWVVRESGTVANLLSVAVDGSNIFAVGDSATVLLSIDNGTSWTTKHNSYLAYLVLEAVVVNGSIIVAGGFHGALAADLILISEDGGDSWTTPLPFGGGTGYWFTDLVYENGLYVATTRNIYVTNNCQGDSIGSAKVNVSIDGKAWNSVLLRDEPATSYSIHYDGNAFITVGSDSTIFSSADGYNWTAFQTPIRDVDYLSAARNGSTLVAAGRISRCYWLNGNTPAFERPNGILSADGGVTWDTFNIDGNYESRGMAFGNGRFVSVGQSTPVSGEGAIYTDD